MNPRLEKMLKLPLYQRVGILALVLAGICAAFYFGLYASTVAELRQLEQKRISMQKKLEEDRKIVANLETYRKEFEKMQERLNEALTELPNEKEIPSLLTTIASLARDNGLEILKFKPGAEQPKGFYAAVPVDLSLVGNYHQVASFFSDIGALSRIVNVGKMKMGKPKVSDGVTVLGVECLATTYRFLETAASGKPAPGARKKGGK